MQFTEIEDKRLMRRSKVFMEEGLPESEALDLAYQMLIRDREGDDLRVCFECQHLRDKKFCDQFAGFRGKQFYPIRFVLQRCEKFQLLEVKK